MTATKRRTTARLASLFALTLLLLTALAPVANAQAAAVEGGSSSNDSGSGDSGAGAPSVSEVIGDATTVGGGSDEGEDGGGDDPTKIIDETIEDAAAGAEDAGGAASQEADNTAGGTVDNLEQSTGRDVNGSLNPVAPGEAGNKSRSGAGSQLSGDTRRGTFGSSFGGGSYGRVRSGLAGLNKKAGPSHNLRVTSTGAEDGVVAAIEQLAQAAIESAKKLAFPLALTVMVVGFLMVQGRVDRKDPKLALAPVTVEHDLLNFQ